MTLFIQQGEHETKQRKAVIDSYHHHLSLRVIPLGFEPKTHALEGRCSNPTELRNQNRAQIYDFLSLFTKI